MKKVLLALGIVLLLMASCRTAYYTPTNVYNTKIPPLTPEIDRLSIETFFRDGTSYSAGAAYSTGTTGTTSSYNSQRFISNSTYVKNPQIKLLRDFFTNETFHISEQFGQQQGSIVWYIETYYRYAYGANASKIFAISTFGVSTIFHLFGVPWCTYKGGFALKADILDKNGNRIASYSSNTKRVKYHVAMWWGYSGDSARSMAFHNPLREAMNEVKSKIMKDSEIITKQLSK